MSGAANEHLNTVTAAQAHAETLAAAVAGLPETITAAGAQISAIINGLTEAFAAVGLQAEHTQTAVTQTVGAAEVHVEAAQSHIGTAQALGGEAAAHAERAFVFAVNAQEQCQAASAHVTNVKSFIETLQGATEVAKNEAVNTVMGVLAQVEEAAGSTPMVQGALGEAREQINQALAG